MPCNQQLCVAGAIGSLVLLVPAGPTAQLLRAHERPVCPLKAHPLTEVQYVPDAFMEAQGNAMVLQLLQAGVSSAGVGWWLRNTSAMS